MPICDQSRGNCLRAGVYGRLRDRLRDCAPVHAPGCIVTPPATRDWSRQRTLLRTTPVHVLRRRAPRRRGCQRRRTGRIRPAHNVSVEHAHHQPRHLFHDVRDRARGTIWECHRFTPRMGRKLSTAVDHRRSDSSGRDNRLSPLARSVDRVRSTLPADHDHYTPRGYSYRGWGLGRNPAVCADDKPWHRLHWSSRTLGTRRRRGRERYPN